MIETYYPDVICLSETWFKDDPKIRIAGYCLYFSSRMGRSGGGVAVLVRDSIPHDVLQIEALEDLCDNNNTNIKGIQITIDQKNIHIFSIYSPPRGNGDYTSRSFWEALLALLEKT